MATKTRTQAAPARKLPIIPIIAGLVGLALVIAIGISLAGSESARTAEVEIGSPSVDGALPAFDSQGADPAVGLPIPAVSGTNFDGDPTTVGPGDGPVGIVFLAHWCSHCQAEVPEIQAWIDGGGEPAAPLYSVATSIDSSRGNYPPWTWLEREGWTAPVLVDDATGSVMRAFGGSAFPYWVFVDGDGNVIARVEGALGADNVAALLELAAG